LVGDVQSATDDDVLHALLPYMRSELHPEGTVLFRHGDPADRLYLVQSGAVLFVETETHAEVGDVFGEVGLFAPHEVRTLTAVCECDCRLAVIDRNKVLELYYQDPKFGFFLIRLVAGRVLGGGGRTPVSITH
jgi:CRP/FNR family transcriptional regulator, cyclic AMP receptor protein